MAKQPDNSHDQDQGFFEPRLPVAGYVLLNLFVWLLAAGVWWATKQGLFSSVLPTVERPGTAALLFFVVISFFLASVYDYFFDGFSARRRLDAGTEKAEEQKEDEFGGKARRSK